MSYDESVKKQAYDLYVEELGRGTKEHNILAKIAKSMKIPRATLRDWRRDDDWSLKANVEVLKSSKTDFLAILQKLQEHVTDDNAVEMGRLVFDVIQSVEKRSTDETETDKGTATESEDVDDGEIFGDDSSISPIFDELREKATDD